MLPESDPFQLVRVLGLDLPGVEAHTKYDGSPVLKLKGCFLAGLATHRSAEPDTFVLRHPVPERDWLIEEAPETYYVTSYYRRYPLILVRACQIEIPALREMLSVSWRITAAKSAKRRPSPEPPSALLSSFDDIRRRATGRGKY